MIIWIGWHRLVLCLLMLHDWTISIKPHVFNLVNAQVQRGESWFLLFRELHVLQHLCRFVLVLLSLLFVELLKLELILPRHLLVWVTSLQTEFNCQMANLVVVCWDNGLLGNLLNFLGLVLRTLGNFLHIFVGLGWGRWEKVFTRFDLPLQRNGDLDLVILWHQQFNHANWSRYWEAVEGNFETGRYQFVEGLFIDLEVVEGGVVVVELIERHDVIVVKLYLLESYLLLINIWQRKIYSQSEGLVNQLMEQFLIFNP